MAKKLTVVVSQGQSQNPEKRGLEEGLVAELLFDKNVELVVVPHLYDLKADGTGVIALQGVPGDMVLLSWLYPRAAHWTLDRLGVKGKIGTSLLKGLDDAGDDEESDEAAEKAEAASRGIGARNLPNRFIWCLDLRIGNQPSLFVNEIRRIASEVIAPPMVGLSLGLAPKPTAPPAPAARSTEPASPAPEAATNRVSHDNFLTAGVPFPLVQTGETNGPSPGGPLRISEEINRRWYPVIDYSRCTNCMECLDFCLFGVYGVDRFDTILVEQPDGCKKGCPACSRVCPENAIIFPQHKTATIAGSPVVEAGGGLKIDLSKLFGAPDALEVAAMERDRELVADGRDAVGLTVGLSKRQTAPKTAPRDELDDLVDELDKLDL